MTKFELARTAGRWRLRSRTYVALAILFVTAWPTNADLFHDAFADRDPRLDAEGEVSSRCGHLPSALPPSASRPVHPNLAEVRGLGCARAVCQALATEAIAESIRSGGVWEAESNTAAPPTSARAVRPGSGNKNRRWLWRHIASSHPLGLTPWRR